MSSFHGLIDDEDDDDDDDEDQQEAHQAYVDRLRIEDEVSKAMTLEGNYKYTLGVWTRCVV